MVSRPERYGRAPKAARTLRYGSTGSAARGGPQRLRRAERVLQKGARHVVVALTAPVRFVADRVGSRRSGGGLGDGPLGGWEGGPPTAGDREPRNPKSGPPADAIALPEPRG